MKRLSSKEIPVTETLETPTEELTTGSTFAGRYQIIEELGKGGMGKVYKVHDTEIKEKVALKLIKPEIAMDKKTIERFQNELKFSRKISHRNVCRMYDLNKEEGNYYITMEYVSGEDLKSMIRMMGQLGAGKSISIAKQVCEGLAEAHRLGVVHRDLKPSNIMIDKEGNARIMDFGIARSLKAKGITGTGLMIGTPEYMSPEQVEGKKVDQRSDIYSLGVNLYEMVTGQLPFEGDTPFTIGMKHKSETPKDPKEINAQIHEDLSGLILKCLEKEKAERYQNVEEVLSELSKIEEGIPTTERVVAKRKLITSKEITVTFSLKKFLIPALVVIALAIVAVVTWQLLPQKGAIILPSDKSSLAILYFKNDTGDEGLNHWRSAFSQWLITDVSQSKHIYVLPVDKLFSIFRKLNLLDARSYATEDLRKVAKEGGVNHIFQASLSKAGEIFRIDYSLQKAATLEILSSDYVTGTGEESFPELVDELTQKIKKNFNLSDKQIADDIDQNVGKITTSSPEAFKYYSQAWEYYHDGDWQKAIETCEKAIALDPDFAMAYRAIANFYVYAAYFLKYEEYMKKAMELSERVSVRERYLIQGDFYIQSERTYDMAMQAYKKLLDIYPDDYDGNYNLGLIYSSLEEWDKAIEQYKMILHSPDESSALSVHVSLAWAYRSKGLLDEAKAVLEDYLTNFADDGTIHFNLRMIYQSQRKFDLAIAEGKKASKLDPIFSRRANFFADEFDKAEEYNKQALQDEDPSTRTFGMASLYAVYLHQGRYEKAKSMIVQVVELAKKTGEASWEFISRLKLSDIYSKIGDYEKALKECEKAWAVAIQVEFLGVQRAVLFAKSILYLKMNEVEKALQTADELKEFEENELNKKLIRYYYNLMGRIELERENYDRAIKFFKDALDLLPHQLGLNDDHAIFIEPLALSYYRAGNLEKAREAYERLTFLTYGRFYHGDIYAKGFYMLGKIHEQQGNTAKAIEHYEKFLDLWKDADPGIAEVEDAKKRLAELKK